MVADRELQDQVLTALDGESARPFPFATVVPIVSQGWITLVGTVEHEEHRYAADRAVRHLPGVKGVTNAIGISRPADPVPRVVPGAERLALAG
jgi:osmotically-inducible protein OsmY